MKILAIDDCRELSLAHVLCRTVIDGLEALKHLGPWDQLHLDHDMGAIQRQFSETGRELTGYDVLNFLEINPQYIPKEIIIRTSNASVHQKMKQTAERLMEYKREIDENKK